MLLGHAAHLLLTVALGVHGCGDDKPGDAGIDGARDSGTDRRDSGEADSGRDTGIHDSGRDASDASVGETRWVPLEGLPDGCVIERAENPETLVRNEWEACPDAEGCTQLVEDPRFQRTISSRVGTYADGIGYFNVIEGLRSEREPRRIVVLASTDGRVLGGWREDLFDGRNLCSTTVANTDGHRAAFAVAVRFEEGPHLVALYAGDVDSIRQVRDPFTILADADIPGSNSISTHLVSPSTLVAPIQPGGFLWVLEGERRTKLAHLGSAVPGNPQHVHLVGDHVIWEEWGSRVRLAHGSVDDEGASYLEFPDADIMGLGTDGTTMVWQQLYERQPDGSYNRIELWTSPYARNPEDLIPRLVTTLPQRQPRVVYGAGVYGFLSTRDPVDTFTLIDIADGRRRILTESSLASGILYISADEIMMGGFGGLRRYQLDLIPYED